MYVYYGRKVHGAVFKGVFYGVNEGGYEGDGSWLLQKFTKTTFLRNK